MLRKIILFVASAAALVAASGPAAAQAEGPVFNEATEEFEGFLHFHRPASGVGVPTGVFSCEVTVKVQGLGTTGEVTQFTVTTDTCGGSGLFTKCELAAHTSTIPFTVVTDPAHHIHLLDSSNVTFNQIYKKCLFGVPGAHTEFASLKLEPNPTEGAVGTLTVSGTATSGGVTVEGLLHAETDKALTLMTR